MKAPGASHYEVLGLQPKATREQIERAHEFFRDMYDEDGLATYSLLEADELVAARARIHEAYEVLCDPVKRHQYDIELGVAASDEPLLPFEQWRRRKDDRGMSVWTDLVDWVGGYPFEVSKPEEVFEFYRERGFELTHLMTCGGGLGCNEFVFERVRPSAEEAGERSVDARA